MDVDRNPDGTLRPGAVLNPSGRPKGRMTWQSYADRVDYYLQEYTRGEIKALVTNPEDFDKLVMRDAFIVQTMAEGLTQDGLASREKLLARVIGEALKRSEITGADGQPLSHLVDASQALLRVLDDLAARKSGSDGGPVEMDSGSPPKPDNA